MQEEEDAEAAAKVTSVDDRRHVMHVHVAGLTGFYTCDVRVSRRNGC